MKNVLVNLGAGAVGVLLGLLLSSVIEFRGCGRSTSDTTSTVVPVVPLPPVTVNPNPAPAVVDQSPELIQRVDSLIQAQARERAMGLKTGDSLLAVMAFKDSLLRVRSLPSRSEQRIEAVSPNGIRITGNLRMIHEPITGTNMAKLALDTVSVPQKVIHTVEYRESVSVPWIIGSAAAGAAVAIIISEKLKAK